MQIGIIGARRLPASCQAMVLGVVKYLLAKGYKICSGGALGADMFALQALLALGAAARGSIFAPWSLIAGFPNAVRPAIKSFLAAGGRVIWGDVLPFADRSVVVAGLLARNERLVNRSSGIVAFLYGKSSGSTRTVKSACKKGIKCNLHIYLDSKEIKNKKKN